MKLGEYYRAHGESDHVALVEAALDDEWRDTNEVTERCGKSRNYVHQVLKYLMEEGRAQGTWAPLETPLYAQQWKWVWRLPSDEPILELRHDAA